MLYRTTHIFINFFIFHLNLNFESGFVSETYNLFIFKFFDAIHLFFFIRTIL